MQQSCREKLETANKLIFVRRYDEADKVLLSCLLMPENKWESLVHLRRIELMSLLGRLEELETFYQRAALQSSTAWPMLYLLLTRLFALRENDANPVGELTSFMTKNGPSAVAYFALGYASEQAGELDRAKGYYEQSVAMDPEWYPSLFGLSQVAYNQGDDGRGDQYFHQFEVLAPYNVYGNFETHRKLSQEFYLSGQYDDSEKAIQMLTTWWIDNKGYAPAEIQVYEMLSTYRIAEMRGDHDLADKRKENAVKISSELMDSSQVDENVLYFLARILEEFGEQALSFKAYQKVLKIAGHSASVVQKIGSHFLGGKDVDSACELFETAYKEHPDNPEIRFCRLVAKLKKAQVNVEDYLAGRERLRYLADHGEKADLLSLLNTLQQKFSEDWDVHFHFAELFLKLGHPAKAGQHYKKMYELDSMGQSSRLRFANYLMNSNQLDEAMGILKDMSLKNSGLSELDAEVQWLKVTFYDRKMLWAQALENLRPLVEKDPWNISYLVQEILSLTGEKYGSDVALEARQVWANRLNSGDDSKVNWNQFAKDTSALIGEHAYGLVYARRKLHFLYVRGSDEALRGVVKAACQFDASKGARDLMKLMNTNFDSPSVYFGLGLLYKELWQLEVASMWFEHTLQLAGLDDRVKGRIYSELADTYVWRNLHLTKAVEYCRLALDIGHRTRNEEQFVMTVMSHALLRNGQPRQAFSFLEQLLSEEEASFEVRYLDGLVRYRNGHPKQANEIWKPLLKFRAEQMREHKIKQEILKFYFEATPYLPVDLSKAN